MSPREYADLTHDAELEAGLGGPGWNARYIHALHRRGLTLRAVDGIGRHIEHYHIQAPSHYHLGPISWVESWIVEIDA